MSQGLWPGSPGNAPSLSCFKKSCTFNLSSPLSSCVQQTSTESLTHTKYWGVTYDGKPRNTSPPLTRLQSSQGSRKYTADHNCHKAQNVTSAREVKSNGVGDKVQERVKDESGRETVIKRHDRQNTLTEKSPGARKSESPLDRCAVRETTSSTKSSLVRWEGQV